ncbi:hypothetical protein GF386_05155 [Candidatus Pacearchaeota archaeon]|nr:hypothetical protein [Candidatus Pacearchaeota archaeon]MBD3283499.1 hypothetical protein [Candidatus Pacearchaeota archaeon]
MGKKAVSPVISTVLLIMIVLILALIILLWSRGFVKEVVIKEVGGESKRAEKFCSEIEMSIDIYTGGFSVTNQGNVPINGLNVRWSDGGTSKIDKISDSRINPGLVIEVDGYDVSNYEELKVIPIVLGKTKSGSIQEFPCPEKYGVVV